MTTEEILRIVTRKGYYYAKIDTQGEADQDFPTFSGLVEVLDIDDSATSLTLRLRWKKCLNNDNKGWSWMDNEYIKEICPIEFLVEGLIP